MDGIRSGQRVFPIGSKQMLALLQAMRPGLTTHGFPPRSRTGRARDVCRMALGHAAGNAVERAYQRAALLAQRRVLMNDWAEFCAKPPAAVVDFGESRQRA